MIKNSFIIIVLLITTLLFACNGNEANQVNDKLENPNSKLFLLSAGLTTDTLRSEFLNYLEKEPTTYSVAVAVNAISTAKKKRKKTTKVKIEINGMGFDSSKIEQFDLMLRDPVQLTEFNIIYILGGNPFLLLEEVKKSGADKVLKELAYQDNILMGYSAGSLLFGPSLALFDYADPILGFNEIGLEELECLGLYDFHIFPHYTDFTNQEPELISKIDEFERQSDLPTYRINDNQGIIYQQGGIEIIGN